MYTVREGVKRIFTLLIGGACFIFLFSRMSVLPMNAIKRKNTYDGLIGQMPVLFFNNL